MRHRMMYRMMWHGMMRHGGPWAAPCGVWTTPFGAGWWYHEVSDDDRIAMLEEYQRDLEQEVEDIAERIKRLKEQKAKA